MCNQSVCDWLTFGVFIRIILEENAGIMMTIGFEEERPERRRNLSAMSGASDLDDGEPAKSAKEFRKDLQKIINLYIASGSKQCINISARMRKKILLSMPRSRTRFSLMNSMELKKSKTPGKNIKSPSAGNVPSSPSPTSLTLERVTSNEPQLDPDTESDGENMRNGATSSALSGISSGDTTDNDRNDRNDRKEGDGQTLHVDAPNIWDSRMTSMSSAIHQIQKRSHKERDYFEQKLQKLDLAVEDVIKLLKRDSLVRFYSSPEYQRLIMRTITELDGDALGKGSARKSSLGWARSQ